MKLFLVVLGVLSVFFCPTVGVSSPFLACDTYPTTVTQPDEFVVTEGAAVVVVPAQVLADGSKRLYYDVQGYSNGVHNLSVKARKNDPLWGVLESASVPFVLTKPASPTSPVGIGLTK